MGTETAEFTFALVTMACLVLAIIVLDNRKKKRDKKEMELLLAQNKLQQEEEHRQEEAYRKKRQEEERVELENGYSAIKQARELCLKKDINLFDYLAAADNTDLVRFMTLADFERDWQSKRPLDYWESPTTIGLGVCQNYEEYIRLLDICGDKIVLDGQAQKEAIAKAPSFMKKYELNKKLGRYPYSEFDWIILPDILKEVQEQTTSSGLKKIEEQSRPILISYDHGRRNLGVAIRQRLLELGRACASDDPEELLELLDDISNNIQVDDDFSPKDKFLIREGIASKIMEIDPYGYAERLADMFIFAQQWLTNQLAECKTVEDVEIFQSRLLKGGKSFSRELNRRLVEIKLAQS